MSLTQNGTRKPPAPLSHHVTLAHTVYEAEPTYRYLRCPYCQSGALTTYLRSRHPRGHGLYTRCLDCAAHLGFQDDVHAEIVAGLASREGETAA